MQRLTLSVKKREKVGKGVARRLRRAGFIPGVVYRAGESMPIELSAKDFSHFISKTAGEQVLVNLDFSGDMKQALLKDYQIDPLKGSLLHADFLEVSSNETVRVMVHIVITGEAIGVKRDNGVMQYGLREVEIECLPDNIPGHIDVDVSNLGVGQSIHVGDLKLGEGIEILTDPDELIVTITALKGEAVTMATETPAEAAEPEVIAKKGKKAAEEEA